MWLILAYIVSVVIVAVLVFNDYKSRKLDDRFICIVWLLVGLIPVVNTVLALILVALTTSSYFMSKMVDGILDTTKPK